MPFINTPIILETKYEVFNLVATSTEQTLDLTSLYTNTTLYSLSVNNIEIKLNDDTNDIIDLKNNAEILLENFEIRNIYYKSEQDLDIPFTIIVTR